MTYLDEYQHIPRHSGAAVDAWNYTAGRLFSELRGVKVRAFITDQLNPKRPKHHVSYARKAPWMSFEDGPSARLSYRDQTAERFASAQKPEEKHLLFVVVTPLGRLKLLRKVSSSTDKSCIII